MPFLAIPNRSVLPRHDPGPLGRDGPVPGLSTGQRAPLPPVESRGRPRGVSPRIVILALCVVADTGPEEVPLLQRNTDDTVRGVSRGGSGFTRLDAHRCPGHRGRVRRRQNIEEVGRDRRSRPGSGRCEYSDAHTRIVGTGQ